MTGASGFLGTHLLNYIRNEGFQVLGMSRSIISTNEYIYGDLLNINSLENACKKVDTIIHCAGYAHAFKEQSSVEGKKHWEVNFLGTKNLVEAAIDQGVKKIIFISTVKVMGEKTTLKKVSEDYQDEIVSDYAKSKKAAENLLIEVSNKKLIETIILRPCMIYGIGGKGNLERLVGFIKKNKVLPIFDTKNKRSFLHISDMCTSIIAVLTQHAESKNKIYVVCGNECLSTTNLIDLICSALNWKGINIKIPTFILKFFAFLGDSFERVFLKKTLFNSQILDRLTESACYSSDKIQNELNWKPTVNMKEGIKELVKSIK
ncbi:NAD-dependent epimerase/dehydratase family protein [Ferrovum sp. PN-J185]|uniref:NAD-dependent epimerase/dehydratase family protein n=1 Tax=Ferrovum sp. PN-J185 TaxID=1356306 RepID=UPI001E4ADFCB|nr:NAD-dependent epimerase/dehydratase family protein [Ferrovum sp. PN-J185]